MKKYAILRISRGWTMWATDKTTWVHDFDRKVKLYTKEEAEEIVALNQKLDGRSPLIYVEYYLIPIVK